MTEIAADSTSVPSWLRRAFAVAVAVQVAGMLVSIALSSIAFAVACVLFLAMAYRDRDIIARTGLELSFALYLLAVLLMCIFALYPGEAFHNSRRVLLIAVVYFIPVAFPDKATVLRFLRVLLLAAAVFSIIEIILFYLEAQDRLAIFQHYMTSAGMKMMLLLLFIPLALKPGMSVRERSGWLAGLLPIVFSLVLTETRSAWLGFLVGLVVIGILEYRSAIAVLAAILLVFFLAAPPKLMERVTHMFTTSTEAAQETATVGSNMSRIRMIRTGFQIWMDYPLTGVGDAHMCEIYRRYVPHPKDPAEGCHLHNTYVHILATHGALGAAAVLFMFFMIGKMEWNLWRRFRRDTRGTIALGALAAFIGFLVAGLAEYNFGDHEILVLLWTTVGLCVIAGRMKESGS